MRLRNQAFIARADQLILPWLYRSYSPEEQPVVQIGSAARFRVRVNSSDIVQIWETWYGKVYEHPRFPIRPEHVVLDIGAHIGSFAVRAAQLARRGRVVACEPGRDNFRLLVENRYLNKLDNLQTEPVAVWHRSGKVAYSIPGSNGALGSLVQEPQGPSEAVDAQTLDELIDRHQLESIDHLKMDVEGAEYEILFGCSDGSLRRIRHLVLEYHELEGSEWGSQALQEFLKQKGFRVAVSGGLLFQGLLFGTGYLRAWREP